MTSPLIFPTLLHFSCFWTYFVLHEPTPSAFVDRVWIDDKRKTGFQQIPGNTENYKYDFLVHFHFPH